MRNSSAGRAAVRAWVRAENGEQSLEEDGVEAVQRRRAARRHNALDLPERATSDEPVSGGKEDRRRERRLIWKERLAVREKEEVQEAAGCAWVRAPPRGTSQRR